MLNVFKLEQKQCYYDVVIVSLYVLISLFLNKCLRVFISFAYFQHISDIKISYR